MKIVKTVSNRALYNGNTPRYFTDFVYSDRCKAVFSAPYEFKGIKSLGLSGGILNEQYDYYAWADTGKLFGILGSMQRVDPRLGWIACVFDVDHPEPQTLDIYQAMMLTKPTGAKLWSQAYKTKKALVSALEMGDASWKRLVYDDVHMRQWGM
jgi:hypothetical protein